MNSRSVLFIFLVFLMACQKEIDWGSGTGSNPGKRLVKIKSRTGPDSSLIEYFYDAAGKLTGEKTTAVSGGVSANSELIIHRKSSGVVFKTVQKSDQLATLGIDSLVTDYYYDSIAARYKAAVFTMPVPGFTLLDSAVFIYDAEGKITSDAHYFKMSGIPLPPVLGLQNNFIYSASGLNITGIQQEAASAPGGPLSPVADQAILYDTKVNSLKIQSEAIVLARVNLYNANNNTKITVTNTLDPSLNFTMNYTYTYNANQMPDSSYGIRTPGADTTKAKYFYQ